MSGQRWDIENIFGSVWDIRASENGFYPTRKTALTAAINRMKNARASIDRNIKYAKSQLEKED